MAYTELTKPFFLETPKGQGLCIAVIDYHVDQDLIWVVIDDETGQIYSWPNALVRGVKNLTIQRTSPERPDWNGDPVKAGKSDDRS
jgi:hypothetical protein